MLVRPLGGQVGQYIQYKGGVVTAEELAPFLDVPADTSSSDNMVDEGFVVPALVRFGGSPEVNASGNLVYRFPTLQRTRQQVCLGSLRGWHWADHTLWASVAMFLLQRLCCTVILGWD